MPRRLTAIAALVALVAAACGDDDGGDGSAGAGGEGGASGEITVWAMGAEGEALGDFAEEFTAENPDITVNVDPLAWDVAHERLITAIAGDEAPDVSQMGTTWMGEFASIGALSEVPGDVDMDAFFEGARETAIVDDTAYGVPWYVETRLLFSACSASATSASPAGGRCGCSSAWARSASPPGSRATAPAT